METRRNIRQLVNRTLLLGAGKLLRPFGISAIPSEFARPCAWGSQRILGSFPPYADFGHIGKRENYFIHDGYRPRRQTVYFDDTQNTGESQVEVYQLAKEISDDQQLKTVFDIGCGSGYKLMRYLGAMKTVGIDVPQTCRWLKKKYPDRVWEELDTFHKPDEPADLVMAVDVIEHLEDPDKLIAMIAGLRPRYVILSTPSRDLLRVGTHNGPPLNPAHIREWSFVEFGAYVSEQFEILEHFISCAPQATQCVLCRPKSLIP